MQPQFPSSNDRLLGWDFEWFNSNLNIGQEYRFSLELHPSVTYFYKTLLQGFIDFVPP